MAKTNLQELQQRIDSLETRIAKLEKLNLQEFDSLKELVNSESWPVAVTPTLICNTTSEEDKESRAEDILDLLVVQPLTELRFLDFGCGEGHVAEKALANNVQISVGYDIKPENWDRRKKDDKLILTGNWELLSKHAPYDVILLYDVLDHFDETFKALDITLKSLKTMLNPGGKLYARCHPWCSRHATHLYHTINKAFIHLVFTKKELKEIFGVEELATRQIIHPLLTYKSIFESSGFRITRENRIASAVEPFFEQTPLVANRIKKHWTSSPYEADLANGNRFPTFQLEAAFVDYVLE